MLTAALQAENARLAREDLNTKDGLDRDRKVLANKAQVAKLQADATTQQMVLDIQATAALQARAAAVLSARQALQEYSDTTVRQYRREEGSVGRGQRERERDAGLAQIEDRYAGQQRDLDGNRAQLEMEGKWTREAREQYEARYALIKEYQQRAVDSYTDHYQRMRTLETDWTNGARESMTNYLDGTKNVAGHVKGLFDNAFKGMENALVSFVTAGKADFKSLATSIISDLARIAIQQNITGPIAKGLAGILSGGGYSSGDQAALDAFMMVLTRNANGGVYDSPGLQAYSGRIVDRPTVFPFAKGIGLMGEAGPEGILPLRRDGHGRLGVSAVGAETGSAPVVFSPSTTIHVDARSDRAAVIADVQRMLGENNRAQMDQLKRFKVLPE